MLARTKKHLTEKIIFVLSEKGEIIKLPNSIANHLEKCEERDSAFFKNLMKKYRNILGIEPNEIFSDINAKYGKVGALIKAIRLREGMNQLQFAKALKITQGDLSKVENGKRLIGKEIAKRISKKFGVNPNMLLSV